MLRYLGLLARAGEGGASGVDVDPIGEEESVVAKDMDESLLAVLSVGSLVTERAPSVDASS